jgi:hypothetical protein
MLSGANTGSAPALDRRRDQRLKLDAPGEVIIGSTNHRCVVLDISAGGARILLPHPIALTETMVLSLPGFPNRPVRHRWSLHTEVGVEFSGVEMKPSPACNPRHMLVSVYAAISPRGHVVRSTIRQSREEAAYALKASYTGAIPLEESGWHIGRLACAVVETFELPKKDGDLDDAADSASSAADWWVYKDSNL